MLREVEGTSRSLGGAHRDIARSPGPSTRAAPRKPRGKMPASTVAGRAIRKWPRLTLYGDLNMRPIRNAWMLEEIGLPYQHEVCRPWSRVAKSVHPMGKVPALLVEGYGDDAKDKFVVLESAAINTFLGDLARELSAEEDGLPALVPPPATPNRAKYDSLSSFVMTELDSQSLWIHRKHQALSDVFGEAPTAVQEARRQFDNALDATVGEIIARKQDGNVANDEATYLLPTGFSAVDIIFANCCFWAQQIGWLERPASAHNTTTSNGQNDSDETTNAIPKTLVPELAAYLKRCRDRPAFVRANELRKNQAYEKKERPSSKL